MERQTVRYDKMVQEALLGVVRRAIGEVAEHGVIGNQHFYITFRTGFLGVGLPDYLVSRYPGEMTIILQHQFYGLDVDENAFSVSLYFKKMLERLTIPFAAITAFVDPSVNFGLQFNVSGEDGKTTYGMPVPPAASPATQAAAKPNPVDTPPEAPKVVSLDLFRKK
ncbi:MAG: hypothetical protein EXQ87_08990 [Alphaproteobacteria bacterium]|nr:hypothetical protein [Alphaproteobacteria bacterium]